MTGEPRAPKPIVVEPLAYAATPQAAEEYITFSAKNMPGFSAAELLDVDIDSLRRVPTPYDWLRREGGSVAPSLIDEFEARVHSAGGTKEAVVAQRFVNSLITDMFAARQVDDAHLTTAHQAPFSPPVVDGQGKRLSDKYVRWVVGNSDKTKAQENEWQYKEFAKLASQFGLATTGGHDRIARMLLSGLIAAEKSGDKEAVTAWKRLSKDGLNFDLGYRPVRPQETAPSPYAEAVESIDPHTALEYLIRVVKSKGAGKAAVAAVAAGGVLLTPVLATPQRASAAQGASGPNTRTGPTSVITPIDPNLMGHSIIIPIRSSTPGKAASTEAPNAPAKPATIHFDLHGSGQSPRAVHNAPTAPAAAEHPAFKPLFTGSVSPDAVLQPPTTMMGGGSVAPDATPAQLAAHGSVQAASNAILENVPVPTATTTSPDAQPQAGATSSTGPENDMKTASGDTLHTANASENTPLPNTAADAVAQPEAMPPSPLLQSAVSEQLTELTGKLQSANGVTTSQQAAFNLIDSYIVAGLQNPNALGSNVDETDGDVIKKSIPAYATSAVNKLADKIKADLSAPGKGGFAGYSAEQQQSMAMMLAISEYLVMSAAEQKAFAPPPKYTANNVDLNIGNGKHKAPAHETSTAMKPTKAEIAAATKMSKMGGTWGRTGIGLLYYMQKGISAHGAAGIVGGNGWIEAPGFDPKTLQIPNGPGRGVYQWTDGTLTKSGKPGRWQDYLAWMQDNNRSDPFDLLNQLDFSWHELNNDSQWSRALPAVKHAKTTAEAVIGFEHYYEGAGHPALGARGRAAQKVLDKLISLEIKPAHHASEIKAPPVDGLPNAHTIFESLKSEYNGVSGQLKQNQLEKLGAQWGKAELNPAAVPSFRRMSAAFEAKFGHPLQLTDWYRSLSEQKAVKKAKPTLAATPGTSIHGWGFAVDLASNVNHANSAESKWMHENAAKFGWYHPSWAEPNDDGSGPDGNGPIEPWHWEFRGSGPVISGKTPGYLK